MGGLISSPARCLVQAGFSDAQDAKCRQSEPRRLDDHICCKAVHLSLIYPWMLVTPQVQKELLMQDVSIFMLCHATIIDDPRSCCIDSSASGRDESYLTIGGCCAFFRVEWPSTVR